MAPLSLILIAGSPRRIKTSFIRQLGLLAEYFNRMGVRAHVSGYGPGDCGEPASFAGQAPPERGRAGPALFSPATAGLAAAILLGHPDQFPFLKGTGVVPVFLWAQLSHPVDPAKFGRSIPVPLTERTRGFLRVSGRGEVCDPIPHGVDTSLFRPLSEGERTRCRRMRGLDGMFVVGSVAAHTKRKRFDRIFGTFALFSEAMPNAFLLLKTDRIRSLDGDDLETMARAKGISGRTAIIAGDASAREMADLYAAMDVYINLSEWEGFCVPVAEAMASGVPVVAQQVQGPGEILPYDELMVGGTEVVEEGGALLSYADLECAASMLLKAAENPELRRALAARGREVSEARFDIGVVGEMWRSLIERTLGRK